jgi:hypothetical protein
MKKTLPMFCMIVTMIVMGTTVVMAAQSQAAAPAADDGNTDYDSLVKKLKSHDTGIDFTALRLSYTKTKDYTPYGDNEKAKNAAFAARKNHNDAEAIKQAESVLEKNYVDMDMHFLCMVSYRQTGNEEKSAFHRAVAQGLVRSLSASGDGTSPEKAYVVISVAEEYFFLNVHGLKMIKTGIMAAGGHRYDKTDVENKKTGEKTTLYFNVDIPFGWLGKSLKKE